MGETPWASVRYVAEAPEDARGGAAGPPWSVPPLLVGLFDDTGLLGPRRSTDAAAVVQRYLEARDASHGALIGQLVCPVSRLAEAVAALAGVGPEHPVDISLVVDTGLGAVPKALSMALSRTSLLTPRSVETAAPPDVDATWLERVAEFVPEDVVAVVEPRRPADDEPTAHEAWLGAVLRVAENGCMPKLRCGGRRASDVPSVAAVEQFLQVAGESGRGFTTGPGLGSVVRTTAGTHHGALNLLVAVARGLVAGDVGAALGSTDGAALAREAARLPERAVQGVRGLLSRCGAVSSPAAELTRLGLLPT